MVLLVEMVHEAITKPYSATDKQDGRIALATPRRLIGLLLATRQVYCQSRGATSDFDNIRGRDYLYRFTDQAFSLVAH